ncbi:nucleoside-diphosphate sugar epimerase/dehydratase [uncultured Halomonas sp.]|uniref:polysaccharide biosynthesis protein n=1 Tax=uncultured Halomonas sp. TaxID=173971 RepID=UPI002631A276|nr:nucleoside-diphosphate sugar epimerase/dehydratase [uncultured Halomonas sp.]
MLIKLFYPLFRLPRTQKRLVQLLADVVLIIFSFATAMLLRLDSLAFMAQPEVWLVLPVMIPVSLLIFIRVGFYRAVIRYMNQKAVKAVLAGVAGSAISLAVINVLLNLPVPRSVPFIYAMLAMLTIGGVRFFLRAIYLRGQLRHKTRVLIYGAGSAGRQLVVSLRQGQEYEPCAFVDDAQGLHRAFIEGLKVYPPQAIPSLIENYGIQKVLMAIPSSSRARRREILESLEPLSVPVQSIPGMKDVIQGLAKINEVRDVAVEDLLGRDPVPPDATLMGANIRDKVVMVTGAGGSIGSELCRQILRQGPRQLVLLEVSEYNLYHVEQDLLALLAREGLSVPLKTLLGSVQHQARLEAVMAHFGVQTVYHAAAYKHVPMVEHNVVEGLLNNVMGTHACAEAAINSGVEAFVLVSTDKAVRPTNVMGASKRLAELVCQALGAEQHATLFSMVRFGNVLGSSGSVVPLFRRQIEAGGPITVTHPDITRYFMTIPEAAQLVIQAGAMARGGDVFVLDMGEPVKIAELAGQMVRLSGLEPAFPDPDEMLEGQDVFRQGDIDIVFTGLRPGEKLYEELLIGEDPGETCHTRIMTANEVSMPWGEMRQLLERLLEACYRFDYPALRELLLEAPTGYQPNDGIEDLLWQAQQASLQEQEQEQERGDPEQAGSVVDIRSRKQSMM